MTLLPNHVRFVSQAREVFRQQGKVSKETPWLLVEQGTVLPPSVNRVIPGHERGSGWRADGLYVRVLHDEAFPGKAVKVRGEDVWVVPGNIIVA